MGVIRMFSFILSYGIYYVLHLFSINSLDDIARNTNSYFSSHVPHTLGDWLDFFNFLLVKYYDIRYISNRFCVISSNYTTGITCKSEESKPIDIKYSHNYIKQQTISRFLIRPPSSLTTCLRPRRYCFPVLQSILFHSFRREALGKSELRWN